MRGVFAGTDSRPTIGPWLATPPLTIARNVKFAAIERFAAHCSELRCGASRSNLPKWMGCRTMLYMIWNKKWDGVLIMLLGCVVFTLGINWGLPSRASDPYLFGDRTPWTGQQIMQLIGDQSHSARGADVDANPITDRSEPVLLNGTDAQRAEIVRRYRLYSHQPDEMNTFMALAQMHPGQLDLDPRMYKYGGLWVYPVGAIIKIAGNRGLIDVRSDIKFYLDHPEEFGKFYIAARLYSVAWGVLGAYVVWRLCRRLLSHLGLRRTPLKNPEQFYRWMAVVGALMFIFMPVVVNMAHEAKPHLAGAVLGMIACGCAMRYVTKPNLKDAVLTGLFCGLSMGMVLTGGLSFILLPAMFVLSSRSRRDKQVDAVVRDKGVKHLRRWEASSGQWQEDGRSDLEHLQDYLEKNIYIPYRPWTARIGHMLIGLMLAGVIYCLTNPYVPINYFRDKSLLLGNLQNSAAFYTVMDSVDPFDKAVMAFLLGTGMITGVLGLLGLYIPFINLLSRWQSRRQTPEPTLGQLVRVNFLLAILCITGLFPFALFAGGQTTEYARLAALPFAMMAVLACMILARIRFGGLRKVLCVLTVALLGIITASYEWSYIADRPLHNSRIEAADQLAQLDGQVVGVWVEPAPFSMPPMDLFKRYIYLLPPNWNPKHARESVDLLVVLPERLDPELNTVGWKSATYLHPLSWANRTVQWYSRNTTK